MLRIKAAPSLKKGNGVASATSAVSRGGSSTPFANVAARLGFKRTPGKPEYEFDFQAPLPASKESLNRRQTMMRRTAAVVYNQMGLSLQSHETARKALLWLNQLKETLTDPEEQAITERLARRLGDLVEELYQIRQEKIERADKLEVALTAAKRKLRTAKVKKAVLESTVEGMGRPERAETLTPEEDHPETAAPSVPLDPELVLQRAEAEVKAKEKDTAIIKKLEKKLKKAGKKAVTNLEEDDENGTS